jgi:hypothetical protein
MPQRKPQRRQELSGKRASSSPDLMARRRLWAAAQTERLRPAPGPHPTTPSSVREMARTSRRPATVLTADPRQKLLLERRPPDRPATLARAGGAARRRKATHRVHDRRTWGLPELTPPVLSGPATGPIRVRIPGYRKFRAFPAAVGCPGASAVAACPAVSVVDYPGDWVAAGFRRAASGTSRRLAACHLRRQWLRRPTSPKASAPAWVLRRQLR